MKRKAIICCSKCRHAIAEICVEELQEDAPDTFVPQVDEMCQFFGIPPYYCGECIKGEPKEEQEGGNNER